MSQKFVLSRQAEYQPQSWRRLGVLWDQGRNRKSSFLSVTKPGREDKGHLEPGSRVVVPKSGEMASEEGGRAGTKSGYEE